jgi:toxin ParE1/3/4
VTYSAAAQRARDHFVAQRDDPAAAARLYQRFADVRDMLGQFPELGRVGRRAGTRELVIADTPYVLIYEIQERRVYILLIRDGRRGK